MKKLIELLILFLIIILPVILIGSITFAIENFSTEHWFLILQEYYFNSIFSVAVIAVIIYDAIKNNKHKN